MGGIVVSQETLLVAVVVLFAVLVLVVVGMVVLATVFILLERGRRPEPGVVFQAQSDFLSQDELAGLAGAFPEGGTHAHQAGMGGDDAPSEAELKAAMEYREAMKVVDRQVERATREVLVGKARPGEASATRLLDPGLWGGPHQAAAPGVKDE